MSHEVGFDANKKIKGRKRFMTVDTLGLVLRVLVRAASLPEREGGKQVLKQVKQMGQGASRLHTIWTDGGFDGEPFTIWVMDGKPLDCPGGAATGANKRVRLAQKTVGSGADLRLAHGVPPIGQQTLSYCQQPRRPLSTWL